MFKAELSDPNILKTSFDAISSIVDEVQIQTDSEGLRLDALDRSHITFVHLELKSSLFDEYVCDEPEKINVDTEELMKVLKRSKGDDRVYMSLDEGNFIITFEGEAKRRFKIRLIDIEYEAPSPPKLEYPTEFEVPFSLLKDSIQDIDIFSDKIAMSVDGDRFAASAEGEFGDANIEYLHGENIDTSARSVFSLEKIKEMLKADKFSDVASISLGDDMPLNLKLRMVSDEGELSFLLAPRIEAED
ncbi:MAG: proliferating cell nuclear antigen (pcna) [Methanobacteriaceae archaeon]|nr:proliferating cell nuclear antigen (pcna) [Methanobacteriaceae archaeon]MDP2836140.1 proliferating cell nuclear antigen (pcna) [Methanobacteriaceae archaeon]MDP3034214.1 proliferating cell nuclear antigen (pcna) [Methanobacteriaceae archaeon]MDP3485980.1 proliferating cell nuclear antigen (pcna) [Methanobacteriaceae archaeon]MDP3624342.1 proliferating cell nuclear antigen (pcna) [Methanobacteriaceae archaeon]